MAIRLGPPAALKSQRRFLIVMSMVLAAYYYFQVHLEGQAEYSGFHVKLGNSGGVPSALWLIWFWSLWRYAQIFRAQWLRIQRDVLREFEVYDHQIALETAKRYARRHCAEIARNRLSKPVLVCEVEYQGSTSDSIKEAQEEQARERGHRLDLGRDEWWVVDGNGKRQYRYFAAGIQERGNADTFRAYDFALPAWGWWRVKLHQFHVWTRTAVRLPGIFEYFMPFVIAAAAVVVFLVYRLPRVECV